MVNSMDVELILISDSGLQLNRFFGLCLPAFPNCGAWNQ